MAAMTLTSVASSAHVTRSRACTWAQRALSILFIMSYGGQMSPSS